MGYYTNYNLDVNNVNTEAEHQAIVDKLRELKVIGYAIDVGRYDKISKSSSFYSMDQVKWYDHDEDMQKLAEAFPEKTFKLSGEGEEPDDRWYCLYKGEDSEYVHAIIAWPEPKRIEWRW